MVASPLRYPGGKAKLFPYFVHLIQQNQLFGSEYCEPYAGGAGLAIKLLTCGFVDSVRINDIDRSVYAFWMAALQMTDRLCGMIEKTPVTIEEWHRQKSIWDRGNIRNALELGFATYFLNRTNRSGIIEGAGPIGGYAQRGTWKVDVRLIKDKQIDNLKSLARYSRQIKVTKLDAMRFFDLVVGRERTFIYLDPPYFVKGHKLYKNFYEEADHKGIAKSVCRRRRAKWVISYDDVPQIRRAYAGLDSVRYSLNYSAGRKGIGTEVMFASPSIDLPRASAFLRVA
jgi:DNA adenine methylase